MNNAALKKQLAAQNAEFQSAMEALEALGRDGVAVDPDVLRAFADCCEVDAVTVMTSTTTILPHGTIRA